MVVIVFCSVSRLILLLVLLLHQILKKLNNDIMYRVKPAAQALTGMAHRSKFHADPASAAANLARILPATSWLQWSGQRRAGSSARTRTPSWALLGPVSRQGTGQ